MRLVLKADADLYLHIKYCSAISWNLLRRAVNSTIDSSPDAQYILVVDDDQYSRDMLRRMLQAEGYQVQEASNGLEALANYGTRRPAVVLLDVNMPEPNGLDVCARLQALDSTNSVPIMMITARDEQA